MDENECSHSATPECWPASSEPQWSQALLLHVWRNSEYSKSLSPYRLHFMYASLPLTLPPKNRTVTPKRVTYEYLLHQHNLMVVCRLWMLARLWGLSCSSREMSRVCLLGLHCPVWWPLPTGGSRELETWLVPRYTPKNTRPISKTEEKNDTYLSNFLYWLHVGNNSLIHHLV